MIRISFRTKTPMCQIDKTNAATQTSNAKILIKKMSVMVDNKNGGRAILRTPIYTSNGFRGMLRREALAIFLEALAKNNVRNSKGEILSDENFHLMNAGGGNKHQAQSFEIEDKVRTLNPLISLFGTSLAIKGKLRVSNMVPYEVFDAEGYEDERYCYGVREDGSVFSSIYTTETIVKNDGILARDKNSVYLTKKQIIEWEMKALENTKDRAVARAENSTEVKKETIASIIDREYVCAGIDFYGSISAITDLTEIEKGLLYRSLERITGINLGSTQSHDFGLAEYNINFDKESVFATSLNRFNERDIQKQEYSSSVKTALSAFDDFLANISLENVEIDEVLFKQEKKAKEKKEK